MTVERLRQAATLLRERAEAATPGPWPVSRGTGYMFGRDVGAEIGKAIRPSDATYMTTMSPPVALALADWLDHEAVVKINHDESPRGNFPRARLERSLAVADAILGDRP